MNTTGSVLLVVDVQRDFLPGGALAVPHGNEVVGVINGLVPRYEVVLATQDWHPPDHCSFAANHPSHVPGEVIEFGGVSQILWPVHCVQGSPGADFAPGLKVDRFRKIFHKGIDPAVDSYSAFFDNARRRSTGLGEYLKGQNLADVHVCGLATDYCVVWSVLDALDLGFKVTLIRDACRGIDLQPGDSERALAKAASAGARLTTSGELGYAE
ncbi:MAG: bifunctional nicotinamidase/pyrazinamidase [Verrucomicrobia bacterium]|nr:bifunctional nicotinamidase/pyrazinamidase [Verrucomicrobiota bacterium]